MIFIEGYHQTNWLIQVGIMEPLITHWLWHQKAIHRKLKKLSREKILLHLILGECIYMCVQIICMYIGSVKLLILLLQYRIFKEMNENNSMLQCNTEKDKKRIHHRTAGVYVSIACMCILTCKDVITYMLRIDVILMLAYTVVCEIFQIKNFSWPVPTKVKKHEKFYQY